MKKTLYLLLFYAQLSIINSQLLKAQVPDGIPYQAVVRDNNGVELSNTSVVFQFSINAGGVLLYREETVDATTNEYGLVVHVIGQGKKTGGTAPSFSAIDWGGAAASLSVDLSINSGAFRSLGSSPYWAVPYAYTAKNLKGGNVSAISISGNALDVANGIRFRGLNQNGAILTVDGVGNIGMGPSVYNAGPWVNSGNDVFYTNGSVGIGTSTPQTSLDVNGDASIRGSFIGLGGATSPIGLGGLVLQDDNGALSYGGMYINSNTTGKPFYGYANNGVGRAWHYVDGNDANKWKLDVNNLTRITVQTDGNVGIGASNLFSNSRLTISDGHLETSQTSAPTITFSSPTFFGGTCSIGSNSTDVAGRFSFSVTTATCGGCPIVTINFNKVYKNAPIVVITPASLWATVRQNDFEFWVESNTSGFSVKSNAPPLNSNLCTFNYFVIESQ